MSTINHEEVQKRIQRAMKIVTDETSAFQQGVQITPAAMQRLLLTVLDMQIFTLACLVSHDNADVKRRGIPVKRGQYRNLKPEPLFDDDEETSEFWGDFDELAE